MVKLIKLDIEGFGKFKKSKVVEFKEGINFITGLNEAGKSTILEGILASLFKYTSPKIKPYICWTNQDICRASLTYKTDKGEIFRVTSDYKNSKRKLEKIDKGKTKEISSAGSTVDDYIKEHFGFDEQKVFENTTFIRQSQMAILGDKITKNKLKDMVEEVLVGTGGASATKSIQKIKKIEKDSKKEAGSMETDLYELKEDLQNAEESKERVIEDSEEHEEVKKELSQKSEELIKLKENKKLFDKKEVLLKEEEHIDEKINQVDDMIETFEREEEPSIEKNKVMSIVLIIVGALLSLTIIGAIIGVPLIIYGNKLRKEKDSPREHSGISEKLSKYQKQKKELINKKAVIESKLEGYELIKFTINDFRDMGSLEQDIDKLKERNVELKTGINKTKELVKSPEEIQEEIDIIEDKIQGLKERAEEFELASRFLEMAETSVQHKFTPAIESNSKEILEEVTDGKYSNLKINEEDLDIQIKAPEIKDYVDVDLLSQGAKDQVYFAIRTTMSDLLSGDINIPLIFDDPFHNFDDIRLGKTMSAIKKLSKDKQIILISHKPYHKEFKNFADNIVEVK
ncbi:AAA family ATPase [Candidatus Pacearchaeota archaeon]|nr:AAA family ATPase [Candidatus Pacearchaeota archaeon]